jgi:hypothetical protein
MSTPLPEADEVMRAIEIYLATAYTSAPPIVVKARVENVKGCLPDWSHCREFVPESRDHGTRYTLRLGNAFYPHMKLAIEPSPGGDRFLYRADTHDKHVCPKPDSPDYPAFAKLMENNQIVAAAIEAAWEQAGLSTFKSYLREDLQRRRAAMAPRE